MLILRQSTAIDIRMGPFMDVTNGATPETGVTIGASDQAEVLKENGAATAAMAGTFAAVTGCDGWYDYTASTTDTNTVGEVVFVMQDESVYFPVYVRAMVVEEAVYDAFYDAGSVGIPSIPASWITATGIATDAITAAKIAASAIGSSELAANAIGATQIAASAITDAKIAAGAITAAKFAAGAVDSTALNADAVTKIMASVVESEGSYTLQQAVSIILAAVAGVTSNGGATLETPNGVSDRIVATVNGSNERTAITLTPSS